MLGLYCSVLEQFQAVRLHSHAFVVCLEDRVICMRLLFWYYRTSGRGGENLVIRWTQEIGRSLMAPEMQTLDPWRLKFKYGSGRMSELYRREDGA
jgi:hypothetical protein